jgi:hypothetical protein
MTDADHNPSTPDEHAGDRADVPGEVTEDDYERTEPDPEAAEEQPGYRTPTPGA